MIQTIQQLLADGKLSEALTQSVAWAKGNADTDTHNALVLLSHRHVTNEKAHLMNQIPSEDYSMERNRITMALLATVQGATAKAADVPLAKRLNWVAIAAFLAAVIAVVANIGTIKDAFFKKEPIPAFTQPAVPPKSVGQPVVLPEKPKRAVDTSSSVPVEPQKTATEPKNVREKVKSRIETAKNRFESRDQSKQINVPDNKGTININQ
jgi:hypothetical protein